MSDCVLTTDVDYAKDFSEFDAVLFHLENMLHPAGLGTTFFQQVRSKTFLS